MHSEEFPGYNQHYKAFREVYKGMDRKDTMMEIDVHSYPSEFGSVDILKKSHNITASVEDDTRLTRKYVNMRYIALHLMQAPKQRKRPKSPLKS